MTGESKKLEPKFWLEMDFGEALGRFVRTDPKEVAESVERSKQKRPPEDAAPRRPARGKRGEAASSDRNRKPDDT